MTPGSNQRRVVVNLVGDAVHGRLAEARFVERPFLPGGEHNMYEFAFAAAALGHEVELRGWLDQPGFEQLADGTGHRPRVDLGVRRPDADDLVIVPEGWQDPLDYGRLALSPARLALFVLAAPGLFGWPFTAEPWERPDAITVPLARLARPEHFHGMAGLGFQLLTHSPGLVEVARKAEVPCAFVGTGRAGWTPPPAVEKTIDVVAILDNRWAPLAEGVLDELEGLASDRIETVGNEELVQRLARARVLAWPSRIEGHATIPWEARAVGCVPVALGSNRFAVGLDEAHGALVVDEVVELAPAISSLLADTARWERLSQRGRATAPAEVDWDRYLERVREFLTRPDPIDLARAPRAGIGAALANWLDRRASESQARLEELAMEVTVAGQDLTKAAHKQEEMRAEIAHLKRNLGHLEHEFAHVESELGALRARRSVRAAVRIADAIKGKGR